MGLSQPYLLRPTPISSSKRTNTRATTAGALATTHLLGHADSPSMTSYCCRWRLRVPIHRRQHVGFDVLDEAVGRVVVPTSHHKLFAVVRSELATLVLRLDGSVRRRWASGGAADHASVQDSEHL